MANHVLVGSERRPFMDAKPVAEADPREVLRATVFLRTRGNATIGADRVSREEFAQRFGADPNDIAVVKTFANAHGLAVIEEDLARRSVVLSGTVAQHNIAFGVRLQTFAHASGSYRGRTGSIWLPEELTGCVVAVMGLDNRPQASTQIRRPLADAASASYDPAQVAALYGYPSGAMAIGECIGLVELGGGFQATDIQQYFSSLKLAVPNVIAVSVDGAENAPTGNSDGPDAEVMLDIEVTGSVAPGASIAVYFAPNTDAGFLDAITTAVHDTVNKPSVISISWGGPESTWTQQAMTSIDQALQAAAAVGVTVCVASGDSGSSDGVTTGNHVDFPASSSYALACGGTSLQSSNGTITSETVWNNGTQGGATGGGVSAVFALPTYQKNLGTTDSSGTRSALEMRGLPDVSGNADPQTGYNVLVDGTNVVLGGTSAVAPLWAGLIALANAKKSSSAGYVNAQLYNSSTPFNDITQGNNGAYAASPGWDACTGMGTPVGEKVLAAIGGN